jgi:hypothetical protein
MNETFGLILPGPLAHDPQWAHIRQIQGAMQMKDTKYIYAAFYTKELIA